MAVERQNRTSAFEPTLTVELVREGDVRCVLHFKLRSAIVRPLAEVGEGRRRPDLFMRPDQRLRQLVHTEPLPLRWLAVHLGEVNQHEVETAVRIIDGFDRLPIQAPERQGIEIVPTEPGQGAYV